jgi:hypothetical protein
MPFVNKFVNVTVCWSSRLLSNLPGSTRQNRVAVNESRLLREPGRTAVGGVRTLEMLRVGRFDDVSQGRGRPDAVGRRDAPLAGQELLDLVKEADDLRNPVDTRMLSGAYTRRRSRLNRRSEQVTGRGVDALLVGRRCGRCGRCRGFGCLCFFSASGSHRAHRDDGGNGRDGRESTAQETWIHGLSYLCHDGRGGAGDTFAKAGVCDRVALIGVAVNPGRLCRRRRCINRWREQVAPGGVDALLRRRGRRSSGRGRRGLGRLLFFLGTGCGHADHRDDRGASGNSRNTPSQSR